ncbi:hypothetical protein R1sor_001282 [Riccia sorocarpa]|uniref:Reverse transcriptase domain-containing protein n=1 Tax=Riccia sorocarpa TaxID=122646 RepID=A0ABD3GYT0_9MARC
MFVITRLLNNAAQFGLPEECCMRRVVPLFKAGPKLEPSSYRTIKVVHVFAKLFGRLLDSRLSTWCEQMGVRAPAQAGFRRRYSTLDHLMTLRVIMEDAKRSGQPLFLLFVDFRKAFDSVSREQIKNRLCSLSVPTELTNAVCSLYRSVLVKTSPNSEGIESTLGVIQGCPLSPTLFGLFIDKLFWLCTDNGAGVTLGGIHVPLLVFADDVVLIAKSEEHLRCQISTLELFCRETGMQLNVGKTKWLGIRGKPSEPFLFEGRQLESCDTYRYLGVDVTANLSWAKNVQARVSSGRRALFSLWSKCDRTGLVAWHLRCHLYKALVRPVILYSAPVWGPMVSRSGWVRLEALQKLFIQTELGVKTQTPYSILLVEVGWWPLEAEALLLSIQYARGLDTLEPDRYSRHAKTASLSRGWFSDLCRWGSRWGFPEARWGDTATMRDRLGEAVVHTLWTNLGRRQQYYLRDVRDLHPYVQQGYLQAPISRREKQVVAHYRMSENSGATGACKLAVTYL